MRVIIAGGGELGARIAQELAKERAEVVVIEKDQARAEHLGEKLSAVVLLGNAAEKEMLRHASADKCEALLALTGDDKVNSAICLLAKSFRVKKIAARVNNPEKAGMFPASGVIKINVTEAAAKEFRKAIGRKRKK